jgi:AcrR family transcriptional regulator
MGRATAAGEPSSNKRDAVLAAAVRCFAARGLAGAGMRDIARAAGLTEGTLYHYFPSKDALIEEAFRWSAFRPADVRASLARPAAPLGERLRAVGEEFLAALRREPDWTRVVIREALRAAPDGERSPMREALVALAGERIRTLAAALRDEMRAGRIAERDPHQVAAHLFHALLGHFVAEAIAGAPAGASTGPEPFLVHLVGTLTRDLEGAGPPRGPRRVSRRGRRR